MAARAALLFAPLVGGQDASCAQAESMATFSPPCNCPAPNCDSCLSGSGGFAVTCVPSCMYCVADYCGLVYRTGAIAEVNGVEATTTIFMHDYTSGRTGTVKVEIGSVIGLEITANGERCSECGEVTCSDGSTKYACDCSNIEDDAFITFCEDNLGITSTDSYFSILLLDVLTSCDVLGVEGEFTLYGTSEEDGDDGIDDDEEPEDDTVENDDIDENDDTDPDDDNDDIQEDDNVDNERLGW
jgi:hypothetical protein